MKKQKEKTTLKWGMVRMLAIGWFLPLVILMFLMMFFVTQKLNRQVEHTIRTSTDKAVEICNMRIEDAVTASKNASYMPTIKNCYNRYKMDGNERALYEDVTLYLEQQYKYNSSFKSTMLYFTENPDQIYYTYRDREFSTYSTIQRFNNEGKSIVQGIARQIDTKTVFVQVNGTVYMVRNIVNSKYDAIAVLVMELDTDEMFESLESIWNYQSGEVYIDGTLVYGDATHEKFFKYVDEPWTKNSVYLNSPEGAGIYRQMHSGRSMVTYGVALDSAAILSEVSGIKVIFAIEIIAMIPMVIMILRFFHRRVNTPIKELAEISKSIEKGNYGVEVEHMSGDQEFFYLDEAFNNMSKQLKNQFEKIFLEEIALRDANIMALQSQINPHFLNNTLEIINWEARMTENYKVSGMIEALSTMLEATMNRKGEQLITLEEELNYVDAYIFIISQRFGEKFEFQKEIDESLLRAKVPRLIIQPIIENAVEHGMNMSQKGWIDLKIYQKKKYYFIEIKDNGKLTREDQEKITYLLSDDYKNQKEHATSLGIRNVDQRLRIIYGDECGLCFKKSEHGHTISRIIVKKEYTDEQ